MGATARAILEIVTDASGVQPGIDKTSKSMMSLSGVATKVGGLLAGAFAITEIVGAATDIVNFAGELTDLSVKTGIGTTALQELKYAGSQVGVELETITGGVTQLQKRIAGGDASAVGAIGALGLSFADLRNKSPEEQFKAIAAEVAKVEEPADRVKLAMDLFGKSGAEMLPLLTDEFTTLTEKANSLGIVMDEETVASMDTLGDTVGDLMSVGTAVIGKVLTPFIPLLTALAQGAMVVADALGDGLGWAIDKIGQGLSWLALQAIAGLRSLLSMGQGITEMFPTLSGAIGLTGQMAGATAILDAAEKALTGSKDAGTAASDRAGAATKKLNLDYAGTKKTTDEAAKAQAKLTAELSKQADILTGKDLIGKVAELAQRVTLAGERGGLSAFQYKKLGKELADLVDQGAVLSDRTLHAIWLSHERLNPSIKVTTDAYQSLALVMKLLPTTVLPAPKAIIPITSVDITKIPGMIGAELGRMPGLELPPPDPTKFSARIQAFFSNEFPRLVRDSMEAGNGLIKASGVAMAGWMVSDEGFGRHLSKGLQSALASAIGAMAQGQGIGAALRAAAPAIGGELGGILGSAIGGPLGKALGSALGTVVGGLFNNGNDTKKGRDNFAKAMGFRDVSGLYAELRTMGEDGAALVHQGLNVIGKKDVAANEAWIKSVQELFDKQKEVATKATEDAATAQAANLAKITDPLKAQLADIDAEYQKLSDSIAKEAPEEIMGVIEAQERAALADLAVQRTVVENELAAAETKVLDTAAVIRAGVEDIFKKPINVTFAFPTGFPVPGAGRAPGFGGAMAEGGIGRVQQPTWFLAGERPGGEDVAFSGVGKRFSSSAPGASSGPIYRTPIIFQADGRELSRVVVQHMGEQLQLAGY